jgi:hypothetical protein
MDGGKEMQEVYLTAKETARALKLSYFTVVRFSGPGGKLPNARLRDGSRRKGLRIPEGDVLRYAMEEGYDRLRHAQAVIDEIREAQARVPAAG